MSTKSAKQVFLSHKVATTGKSAMELNAVLEKEGYSTFLCTAMGSGDAFRYEITQNAANCKVMIVFLDESWAGSGECISEFNCAFSLFNRSQKPKIVPIIVGGFDWIDPSKYPVAHCITANFQCLTKIDDVKWSEVFSHVLSRVNTLMVDEGHKVSVSGKDSANHKLLEEMLTCEICQEVYREPKLLPCNHTFCKQCLVSWKKTKLKQKEEFTCPKCRLPCIDDVNALQSDFRANRMIEFLANEELSVVSKNKEDHVDCAPAAGSLSSGGASCEKQLQDWFTSNSIPQEVQEKLVSEGFEFYDIVIEMTEVDVKDLGIKPGHQKKLVKCINDTKCKSKKDAPIARPPSARKPVASKASDKKRPSSAEKRNDWSLIAELYDDRVLTTGTHPGDSLKFWAALSQKQNEDMISSFRKQADSVETEEMALSLKSKSLQQVAMVFCDAGSYTDAMKFAKLALTYEHDKEREYNLKMILIYATHGHLKSPMWITRDDNYNDHKQLVALCEDCIKNGAKYLSKSKLCKAHILKAFTEQALVNRYRTTEAKAPHIKGGQESLTAALELAKSSDDKGLLAEATMTRALYLGAISGKAGESFSELLKARKLTLEVYGEFSVLMCRIYYNIGIDFEVRKIKGKAYECFRRAWLVNRQLYGPHHPTTKKTSSVLTDDYRAEAVALNDNLPDSDDPSPNERDRNYQKRIKFLN